MNYKNWAFLVLLLVIFVAFLSPSCAKKRISTEPISSEEEARRRAEEEARQRELERQASIKEEGLKEGQLGAEGVQSAKEMFENEDIFFEFDSASLSVEAQGVLRRKAEWLKGNPGARVIIEGHCDERGTNEYNLALGDRRAYSSKSFLMDLGIDQARLTTVSYGEERPVDTSSSEEAWSRNRRAHFVIK